MRRANCKMAWYGAQIISGHYSAHMIPTVNQPPMRKLALILARTQALNCFRLLSFAFVCFHLRAPCFHHAFSLHLYPASIKPDSTMTSLLIDSNRVNRYTSYAPTKPQTRHNIDHSKAKWCWFSTRACFRLARVCVQLWALAYISPSPEKKIRSSIQNTCHKP